MQDKKLIDVLKPDKINRWQLILLHIIFILALFSIVAPQYPAGSFLLFLFYKLISLTIILVPVYIHLYWVFPYFLKRNKWLYVGMLLKLIVLFTLISYFWFQNIDPAYVPAYFRHNHPVMSILLTLISLVMIIGATMLLKFMEMFEQQKLSMYELKQRHLESELQFLKLQISPHFYFNIMNSIYHSIKIDPEQAERIVMQLSDIMKYQIYYCLREKVELEYELKNIHNYIGLQKMRFSADPQITIEVKGDLVNQFIAPFILITFVENAFKHGLEKQSKQQSLLIRLNVSNDVIQFHISNSKTTLGSNGKAADGAGLMNVKKRLELLYPSRHELLIDDRNDLYTVDLSIQLN